MNALDKIKVFFQTIQDEVWNSETTLGDLNDLELEFITDYGWKLEHNTLQLNFSGSSDNFYFISIPDDDMSFYKEIVDQYPIYYIRKSGSQFQKFLLTMVSNRPTVTI